METASPDSPRRGEIWLVALGAGRTGEPGKTRPAVVVSADALTTGQPEELIVVVPLTGSLSPSALRIEIDPAAGLDRASRAVCRAVRAVVASRLVRRIGAVTDADMHAIEGALAMILGFVHDPPARQVENPRGVPRGRVSRA
ncbi:MAG: type II toxin-antitoxin system PemK/MazF family toxin [Jatrophihabitans sp.]|nr:MAG: type II toxin-antitoxin system PemK/MazF family toxin [Jatrophihabitans sp.]